MVGTVLPSIQWIAMMIRGSIADHRYPAFPESRIRVGIGDVFPIW